MLPTTLTSKNSAFGAFPIASSPFQSLQMTREQRIASLIRGLSVNQASTISPCSSTMFPSQAPSPLASLQARYRHLQQGNMTIESAVFHHLQQRSIEAAELATILRLRESFGGQRREVGLVQSVPAPVQAEAERSIPSIISFSSLDDSRNIVVTKGAGHGSQPVCKTSKDASMVLQTLGSTFRTKEDTYIDASRIKDPGLPKSARGGKHVFFPDKLYKCLGDLKAEGKEDIARFLSHGRAFVVLKPEQFEQEVMPQYFDSIKKWSSFTRQLYLWGFVRVASGPDAGAFWHELFLERHDQLLRYMRRVGAPQGVKEDRRKTKHRFGVDPDFYAMDPLPGSPSDGGQ